MKKIILTLILLTFLTLSVFSQQEQPMFFDSDLGLKTGWGHYWTTYSLDGSKIATANNKKIIIWDAATGREICRLTGHSDDPFGIVFSPDGRQVASFDFDETIKIWNVASGQLIRSIPAYVNAIAFSPDSNYIIGASGRNYDIIIWNTANGSEIRRLTGHTSTVWSITYSPDGKQIATASVDRTVRIWDAGTGQLIRSISNEKPFSDIVYSPSGRNITAYAYDPSGRGDGDYTIRIYNAETSQELRTIPVTPSSADITMFYSQDGRQLLVNTGGDSNGNNIIKILDPETGRELRSFSNSGTAFAFSPDGRRILTASTSFMTTIAGTRYTASYATLIDSATGATVGTIGYGPLNVGAKAFADMQIARFLNDTAGVTRNEAILQYITANGHATRAQIETFYRNNVGRLIGEVVDREFNGITIPAQTITYVKQSLTNFFTTPNQNNFNTLKSIYDNTGENLVLIQSRYENEMSTAQYMQNTEFTDIAEAFGNNARATQNLLNSYRRQLNAPNDAPIDWGRLGSAYRNILNNLSTTALLNKMR